MSTETCKSPRWPVFTMINYVTQSGCCLEGRKAGQKGIYFPLKVVNLAHFMSFSTASSSKNVIKLKKEKETKKKKDPAFVPVPVNAHADILDSPKAKRIVSKCGKCSLSSAPQLKSRVPQRVARVEGVLFEGQHWMVMGEGRPPPRPPHLSSSSFKMNRLSQDVSPSRCSPHLSYGDMLSSLVDLLG